MAVAGPVAALPGTLPEEARRRMRQKVEMGRVKRHAGDGGCRLHLWQL
jgi:hypothetical protein